MSQYTFVFDNYEIRSNELIFRYAYKDNQGQGIGHFEESYKLSQTPDANDPTIQYILRIYHLLAGVSYYKSLLGNVKIPYQLSQAEADYLNEIYDNGLGEFSFLNKLTDPIRPFQVSDTPDEYQPVSLENDGAILGIGGGKDSVVVAEVNKAIGLETSVLSVATRDNHGQAGPVMDLTGLPKLQIGRYVDTGIVDFTEKYHGMHGHIPLSALLAWLGVLTAYLNNKRYILMGNEASSSSGNVEWNGRVINHQWSKSYDAEKLTQDFVRAQVSPDLWYFSPIRPYGSLAVLELFAKLGKPYYQDFTSCNLVLRIDPAERPNGRWCTHCAKCLSTWLLLTPWMSVEELSQIFGRNLFDDTNLRPTLEALLGQAGHKPLDCVGTTEELRAVTRQVLESKVKHPLLEDIEAATIPGPSVQELTEARSPANIPEELAERLSSFINTQLKK